MCGICGLISLDGRAVDPAVLDAMNETLVHRGPDSGGRYVDGGVALWDTRERRFVLARDSFGIKPMYYRVANGTLAFGSELKALLRQPGFSRDIDLDALESFLEAGALPG